jgi:predicted metal-dependent phosphoesterase TrpH
MRCDLHVHSRFSGAATIPVLRHLVYESVSEPGEVYEQARRRGMDLVTITDHDTIEGALAIAGRPDTFVSEEVTCLLPEGRELHIGVYDLSETQHHVIAERRCDPEALFAYLAEQRLPAALNHPFSALTGDRKTADLSGAFSRLNLVECCNGMLPEETNEAARQVARGWGLGQVGGSDAHTLPSIGRAYTVVPGAEGRADFLEGLRRGCTIPRGSSGTYARFARDLARLAAGAYEKRGREALGSLAAALRFAGLVALGPLVPLLPLVAAFVFAHERRFALRHFEAFRRSLSLPPRPSRPTLLGPPMGTGGAIPALTRAR